MKIVTEDKAIESRTNDFLNDWERAKPVAGDLRPGMTNLSLRTGTLYWIKWYRRPYPVYRNLTIHLESVFINAFFPNQIDDALQKLAIFESKYVRLKDERDNVAKAKEALELQDVSVNLVS
jgi:dynein heavy chain 1